MKKQHASNIFNYDFDWYKPKKSKLKEKEVCCEKHKKKGEKKCKSCPKRAS